jgi:hypothetical protein
VNSFYTKNVKVSKLLRPLLNHANLYALINTNQGVSELNFFRLLNFFVYDLFKGLISHNML